MHEIGIVPYIIKEVKEALEGQDVKKVTEVIMRIGEVSNVVHGILIDGWNWYVHKETGPLKDAKLTIEKIDAITHCDSCGKDYETIKYGKKCPHCGSENTYLLQGNEVEIKEIKIY